MEEKTETPDDLDGKRNFINELENLTSPGVLGFYTGLEIVTVFAKSKNDDKYINIFSIAVAENIPHISEASWEFLSKTLHEIKAIKEWRFGIVKQKIPLPDVTPLLTKLIKNNIWDYPSDSPLHFGKLFEISSQFVPPNIIQNIPLNCVLKNNLWNGSHVFELFDAEKRNLKFLFANSVYLKELSTFVERHIPINLVSLSDRFGNFLIQLPVTIIASNFLQYDEKNHIQIEWHPNAKERNLKAIFSTDFDSNIYDYNAINVNKNCFEVPAEITSGKSTGVIYDEINNVVLAAKPIPGTIECIETSMGISSREPRVFDLESQHRVYIEEQPISISRIGNPKFNLMESTQKRIYKNEEEKLAQKRVFKQYRPKGSKLESHNEALKDLHFLIDENGKTGAWLWDPYLSSNDIVQTLFFCKHSNSDLRALTSGGLFNKYELDDKSNDNSFKNDLPKKDQFVDIQKNFFKNLISNYHRLKLEYRISRGNSSWEFHDRFLIFPKTDRGALAWSLGTSINSFGTTHHILQQVDNGELIKEAFLDLWNVLNQNENLIWKR